MKERQLIGMVEYIFQQDKIRNEYATASTRSSEFYDKIVTYAHFLNQPLTLGMFVPCDEDWNVYESEPQVLNTFTTGLQKLEYQAAKERVIFEGWDYEQTYYIDDFNFELSLSKNPEKVISGFDKTPDNVDMEIVFLMDGEIFKVSDLLSIDIYLTESTYNKYFK